MGQRQKIILTILTVKVCTFLLIVLAFFLLPFATRYYYANFQYPFHAPVTLATAYQTWDAQHYLFLSEKGYAKNIDSNAFPPLLPLLIHGVSFITRNSFVAGLLVTNIFSVIGLYLFYIFTKKMFSEKVAYRSLLFFLAFPTSFYFSLIYTESIFLFLVISFFIFLQQKKIFFASLSAFFLPMTRIIGTAILIPFVFSYILEYHAHSLYDELSVIVKSFFRKKSLFLLSPLIGLGFVMCVFYITTGNFFTQFTAQENFVSQYSFFSIFNPLFFLRALFTFPLHLHGFTDSLLDRVFFLLFLTSLPFLWKRVSLVLFIYTITFGLLPVLSGSFMSYMRYLVVLFPLFIGLGRLSLEKKYKRFTFPFLFISITVQALFIIMHSLNYWVS